MSHEKGSLSIHSENIFPIIKKWLYSDHDIFIREVVSNACDAITKLRRLNMSGEADLQGDTDFKITITLDKEAKTLTFSDNGIGMTDEEIHKYINQIAFSGAEDFLNKYKDKADQEQIIGHFGLGFYSTFMVADQVEIHTQSYLKDAAPMLWKCNGGTEFEMEDGSRTARGTDIILHLGDEGKDFLVEHKVRDTIEKYCAFMPYPIFLEVAGEKPKTEKNEAGEEIPLEPKPLNEVAPLYTRQPSACTDQEYKEFYRKTFMDFKEPLFWIHLNMDYPFNLKGILYFPRLSTEFDTLEGRIKLYNNQVFVADNIKEAIPEYLLLLKGIIDCPDLPLNVSRSFLQNDGFVKKISDYISKKVADKLNGLFNTERSTLEGFWDDLHPFIKYGCLKDTKFEEKLGGTVLYKTTAGEYLTLQEYLDKHTDTLENQVYYVTDQVQQTQYVQILQSHGVEPVLLEHSIDAPFISLVESKKEGLQFKRVDSDLSDLMKEAPEEGDSEAHKAETESLTEFFKTALKRDDLKLQVESLKNEDVSGMIILSENNRRMQDMFKSYGMKHMDPGMFPSEEVLILNRKHPLVQYVLKTDANADLKELVARQVYDLAMMSHKPLTSDQMTAFIQRSNELMKRMINA